MLVDSCKIFQISKIHQISKIPKPQECIPVGCIPPASVAVGGISTRHPPRTRHPPDQAPLPPRTRHPLGTRHPLDQAPPGQTHTCKHITLPQTSFSGGKNVFQDILSNFDFLPLPFQQIFESIPFKFRERFLYYSRVPFITKTWTLLLYSYFSLENGHEIRQSRLSFDNGYDDGRKQKTYKFGEIPLLQQCVIHTISRYL